MICSLKQTTLRRSYALRARRNKKLQNADVVCLHTGKAILKFLIGCGTTGTGGLSVLSSPSAGDEHICERSAGIYVPSSKTRRKCGLSHKEVIMFIPCSEREGTAYFEFQFCKKKSFIHRIFTAIVGWRDFWAKDSLLVEIEVEAIFFKNYGEYLKSPTPKNGFQELDPYGVNYYTKEQTLSILEGIEKAKPKDFEVLVAWLEKAATEYNGFYFIGI